jgi:NLR family CARD domain-containing protein 3
LGKAGASALASALSAKGCNLISLVLAGCQLGPSGAESLAEMLKKNTTLRHLRIPYNGIGPLGAVAFAHVIPHNRSLSELDLRGNSIGASGGEVLAAALLKNCGALRVKS